MAGGSGDLLILDSSLLWQAVSNAADKYTATQTVRSEGFLCLNPIAMSVFNCNIAQVVECSCLKPVSMVSWCGVVVFLGAMYMLAMAGDVLEVFCVYF